MVFLTTTRLTKESSSDLQDSGSVGVRMDAIDLSMSDHDCKVKNKKTYNANGVYNKGDDKVQHIR